MSSLIALLKRWRQIVLWLCLALFALRVVGQIEVVLLSPAWLPPFTAWEFGLIPIACCSPLKSCCLRGWPSSSPTNGEAQGISGSLNRELGAG